MPPNAKATIAKHACAAFGTFGRLIIGAALAGCEAWGHKYTGTAPEPPRGRIPA
ncbi:hypothetical protein GCM10009105_22280 [Dokdonella soli]|uniref:Lipoprotein n=1 Tax=Dokdonella soli TaxID=529810 RepID=A0ABN1IKB6_9GAMM